MVQLAHTSHACRFCRQKRCKCNGENPCDRCRRWSEDCVYDDRTKEKKCDLRKERDQLQSRARDADAVFQALRSGDLYEETLASLWSRTPLDQIAASLGAFRPKEDSGYQHQALGAYETGKSIWSTGEILATTSPMLQTPPTAARHSSHYPTAYASILPNSSVFTIPSQDGRLTGVQQQLTILKPPEEPWAVIGLKSYEVQELLSDFFDWQYVPLFAVDRNSMEWDLVQGKRDACSPALLRSVLCLACRSVVGYDTEASFYVNLGSRLFQEAKDLLYEPKDSKEQGLPDAQACGLLAIHQLGGHNNSDALILIEKCVRMLVNLTGKTSEADVGEKLSTIDWTSTLSNCLHGAVALCRIIHLFFECLDTFSESENFFKKTPSVDETVLQVLRAPVVAKPTEEQHTFPALLVNLTSTVYCFLSAVSQPVVDCPHELLNVYHGCLSHYSDMIAQLQSMRESRTSMFFTHLVYHFSLLSLLRPFCHLAKPDGPVDFRAVCLESAQAILLLSKSYQELVSNRELPVFVPLFVYAAGLVCFELSTSARAKTQPPFPKHSSSIQTEASKRSTDTSLGTEATSSASVMTSMTPLSITASSPEQTGLPPRVDTWSKRRLDQIPALRFGYPMQALGSPGVLEAIACLNTMSKIFPAAKDAREHLSRLISSEDLTSLQQRILNTSFLSECYPTDKGSNNEERDHS